MKKIFFCIFLFSSISAQAQWTIDFSRREEQMGYKKVQLNEPLEKSGIGSVDALSSSPIVDSTSDSSVFDKIFQPSLPTQEIVILNTEQGFVPSSVRVREGAQYKLIVVNVNEKAKNISFVLDSFSEHHATFYGKLKSFLINPKKEGVYTFVSPETSAQGRLIVHPGAGASPQQPSVDRRAPASTVATPE